MKLPKSQKMQMLSELILEYVDYGPDKYTATQVADELYKISGIRFDSNKVGQTLQMHGYSKCGKIASQYQKNGTPKYFNYYYTLKIGPKAQHKPNDYVIQFGKYCGYRLSEVQDLGYLVWMRNTVSLASNVIEKIDARIQELRKPVEPLLTPVCENNINDTEDPPDNVIRHFNETVTITN